MRSLDEEGQKRHWILEIHFVDRERQIGGFYEGVAYRLIYVCIRVKAFTGLFGISLRPTTPPDFWIDPQTRRRLKPSDVERLQSSL